MNRNGSARWFNIAIGVWLFISAFIWLHTYAQFTNSWIVGLACACSAVIALRVPQFRYINALLAMWLFASVWALPLENVGTLWNNLLSAVAIFFVALVPDAPRTAGGHGPAAFPGGTR